MYLQSLFESAWARNDQRVTRSDGALYRVTNLWSSWPSYRVLHAAMAELSVRQSIGLECSGTDGENFRSTWMVEGDDGQHYIFAASSQSFSFRKCDDGDKTFTAAMAVAEKIVHSGTGTGVENQIDGMCSAVTVVKKRSLVDQTVIRIREWNSRVLAGTTTCTVCLGMEKSDK